MGDPTGRLAGNRLAVKDVIDVAGRVTGAGNPDLAASRAPAARSAPVVEALVAAGATVVGKTVTDELAYSLGGDNVHFPDTVNVAAPGRTTGGSSSGSAAAVTAGLVDLALGTDTGGSIRVPAGYCGIHGWRPSHGAVSTEGVTPLAPSFDTVGAFARNARLLRTAAEVMLMTTAAGQAMIDGRSRGVRRVVIVTELFEVLDPAVAGALLTGVTMLFGEEPEHVTIGVDLEECLAAFRTLQGAEAWAEHGDWITTTRPHLGPATAERFRVASEVTPERVGAAQTVRDRVADAAGSATGDGTVLIGPAAAGPAPLRGVGGADPERIRTDTLRLTTVAGLARAPVVVVPGAALADDRRDAGAEALGEGGTWHAGMLPVGIALMGAPGTDLALLDLVT